MEGAYVFIGAIMTMVSNPVMRWPYNRQSANVSSICEIETGSLDLEALVGSLRMTRVTMMDASRWLNMLNDIPKMRFGDAELWGRYKYATTARTHVKIPSEYC